MKKLERRAIICLLLAAVLLLGLCLYCFRFFADGSSWVSYPANQHIYQNGVLASGSVYDRDGVMLADVADGTRIYNDSATVRRATAHAVGDKEGNIATGALTAFGGKLSGYNFLTGTHSLSGNGRTLALTVDSDVNVAAYEALAGRHGAVMVYNYETGEIVCLVSAPGLDPADPAAVEGSYINKALSATFVPGSIFKLVTTAAAIDNLSDLSSWSYECTGALEFGPDRITCPSAHGTVDLPQALAMSCNCAYATLSLRLGEETLAEYVRKLGLTQSVEVNSLSTAAGSFSLSELAEVNLAWSGIGQYHDLVNPCAFMVYMGAIANGGVPVEPQLIQRVSAGKIPTSFYIKHRGTRMLSESTAARLAELMHNNVVQNYGEGNYPNLDLCAKSGTAEVGEGQTAHAWFAGFIRNENYPLAFVVLIENGGSGSGQAGAVANAVLQAAIRN